MSMNVYPYAFFKNQITEIENAKVSIMTNALQYGTGFFAGIRAYYNDKDGATYLFRIDDHFQRFILSSRIIGCKLPFTKEEFKKITVDLVKKNAPKENAYLRPFAYAGHTKIGPNLANIDTLDFSLHMIPLGDYLPIDSGLRLMVSSWRRISDNAIPTRAKVSGSYINSALAKKEADDNGFDEAILLHENGQVSEGSAENLFLVRNGILVTPAETDNILEGIVRRTIMQLAKELNIPVEVRSVSKTELYIADEVFLSGTGCQVAWVSSVDNRAVGDGRIGEITEKLQKKFFDIVTGRDQSHPEWLTKVELE